MISVDGQILIFARDMAGLRGPSHLQLPYFLLSDLFGNGALGPQAIELNDD